jgi:hypothetical protein
MSKREASDSIDGFKVKREKSNAKSVECLDMDGNLIEVYPSGIAISTALNIPQGDISLCCRGLKHSIGGYRFRFHGDTSDQYELNQRRKAAAREAGPVEHKDNTGTEQLTRTRRRASVMYTEIGEDGEPVVPYSDTREGHTTVKATPNMDHITHIKV